MNTNQLIQNVYICLSYQESENKTVVLRCEVKLSRADF